MQPTSPTVRLAELDGLRGLAVLMVMVYHFVSLLDPARLGTSFFHHLVSIGWVGVEIFFVLSGFLITGILLKSKGNTGYFRNFYARRTLRIFPIYYLVLLGLLAYSIVNHASSGNWPIDPKGQFWLWTYTANFASMFSNTSLLSEHFTLTHFWSLAIEEQFYLFWPLLVFWLPPRHLLYTSIFLILTALGLRVAMNPILGGRAVYHFTFTRLDGLLTGSLIAMAQFHGKISENLIKIANRIAGGCVTALIAIAVWRRGLSPTDRVVQAIGYLCIILTVAAILLHCTAKDQPSRLRTFLSSPGLRFFGIYSYGIYLFHGLLRPVFASMILPLDTKLNSYPLAAVVFLGLSVALSTGIAMASFHLIESKFLAMRHRFE